MDCFSDYPGAIHCYSLLNYFENVPVTKMVTKMEIRTVIKLMMIRLVIEMKRYFLNNFLRAK